MVFALSLRSAIEPHRHAWLKDGGIAFRIEAQAKGVAIVIANCTLGLPGGKRAKRHHLGDHGGRGLRSRSGDLDLVAYRETMEHVFAGVERQPLFACCSDREHRLAGCHVLAHFGDNDADNAIRRCSQNGLVQSSLEYRDRTCRRLDLSVGDRALFAGRAGDRRGMIRLGLGEIGTGGCKVALSLIEILLLRRILRYQLHLSRELALRIV